MLLCCRGSIYFKSVRSTGVPKHLQTRALLKENMCNVFPLLPQRLHCWLSSMACETPPSRESTVGVDDNSGDAVLWPNNNCIISQCIKSVLLIAPISRNNMTKPVFCYSVSWVVLASIFAWEYIWSDNGLLIKPE